MLRTPGMLGSKPDTEASTRKIFRSFSVSRYFNLGHDPLLPIQFQVYHYIIIMLFDAPQPVISDTDNTVKQEGKRNKLKVLFINSLNRVRLK